MNCREIFDNQSINMMKIKDYYIFERLSRQIGDAGDKISNYIL